MAARAVLCANLCFGKELWYFAEVDSESASARKWAGLDLTEEMNAHAGSDGGPDSRARVTNAEGKLMIRFAFVRRLYYNGIAVAQLESVFFSF